jgi:hypothetical protein
MRLVECRQTVLSHTEPYKGVPGYWISAMRTFTPVGSIHYPSGRSLIVLGHDRRLETEDKERGEEETS